MQMLKRILLLFVLIASIVYLLLAVFALNKKPDSLLCSDIELVIKDKAYEEFISKKEIESILKKKNLEIKGKELSTITTQKVEEAVKSHPLVANAECYKTPSGKIFIEVEQRIPLLRIMNQGGGGYYIDSEGEPMPVNQNSLTYLIVVTGNTTKEFAKNKLLDLGLFLKNDSFWDAQIEQINVRRDKTIELVPRVGNHIVYLGSIDDFENKLGRLKKFYSEGLDKVGWNKYSRINLEFSNQIICTKR